MFFFYGRLNLHHIYAPTIMISLGVVQYDARVSTQLTLWWAWWRMIEATISVLVGGIYSIRLIFSSPMCSGLAWTYQGLKCENHAWATCKNGSYP